MFSTLPFPQQLWAIHTTLLRMLTAVGLMLVLASSATAQPADQVPTPDEQLLKDSPSASEVPKSEDAGPDAAHFKTARAAIRAKDWERAIAELEAAVKIAPKNGVYHHALGVAYMGDQQANAGWFHFRQAVRLAPAYVPATVDFMKTWKLLDAQGVFHVGTKIPLLVQTLGKPDQADDQGPRLRLVYGFMSLNFLDGALFSILDLRNLPPDGLHAVDGLAFDLPRDVWKVAYRMLSATQGNTEYVRLDDNLQSWKELFSSQRFINTAKDATAVQLMNSFESQMRARYDDLNFEILSETSGDVLFSWSTMTTDKHPAQHELVRLVQGDKDIHRLAYTRKGEPLTQADRETWLQRLRDAELMTAEKLRAHFLAQEKELQEEQLRDVSVQILEKQFELIRAGKTDDLKGFFTQAVQEKITPELLELTSPKLDQLDPAELVSKVDLINQPQGQSARLIQKDGTVFTTLIQAEGGWFADSVWLETVVK